MLFILRQTMELGPGEVKLKKMAYTSVTVKAVTEYMGGVEVQIAFP